MLSDDLRAEFGALEQQILDLKLERELLREENATLRRALCHYANHKNWTVGPTGRIYAWVYTASDRRATHVAKEALGPPPKENRDDEPAR